MKKILIPTDFSDNAWNATVYALKLYRDIPVQFYILNVANVNQVPLVSTISSHKIGYVYDQAKRASKAGLENVIADIKNSKPSKSHHFISATRSGEPVSTIVDYVIENEIDLIIMGTQGATGAEAIFLGSITHKIIKTNKNCPVLAIPKDFRFKHLATIGFATDFKKIYYASEVALIIEFTRRFDAVIRMVEIYKKPELNAVQEYNLHSLEHFFKNEKYEFHTIPDFANVTKGIQVFIEELEVDLITLINYKHSFIERIIREPVIKKIVFNTQIPFLIIPADE